MMYPHGNGPVKMKVGKLSGVKNRRLQSENTFHQKGEMIQMKLKKTLAVMLACAMMASFAACGSSSASTESGEAAEGGSETTETTEASGDLPEIGVTIYKYDDNFMTYTRTAMENAAEGKATLIMNDSQNDQAKQGDQVDTMLQKGVKSLIINLVDPSAAPTIAEKAKAQNVPVVFINKEYPDGTNAIGYDKCVYVGTTSEESGIIQGQLILDAWNANKDTWDKNGDGKLQYVMLMGEVGHPDAEARTKYSISTLNDAGVETEELANQSATWDTTKAKELMETWLGAHGDKIEAVISNNDGMALGAIEALKAAGYFEGDKFMPVFGVDALPEALDCIEDGTMVGTVLNDPLGQGTAAVDIALNYANGKEPLEGTEYELDETGAVRVPYQPITKDNLDVARTAYGM